MVGLKRCRCGPCAPEVREAARLLSRIVKSANVVHELNGHILFSFEADIELHDRLCVWGARHEDTEDDTPLERTY